jgi:hypothetical protein
MPLINFRTNLTSLRFGADQPGGGDSGQPFVQFPIDGPSATPQAKNIYELNRTSLDFPIRGGAITSLVDGTYTTNAAIIDLDRIKKFFKSAPQGTAFIEKQRNLQLTNPRTQVPNSLQFAGIDLNSLVGLRKPGNAVIPVTQVYNPNSTLAQIGASGTGAHFNRHGVGPTIYESVKGTYQYVAGAAQNNTEVTNRLAILRALKLVGNTQYLLKPDSITGFGIDPALIDRLGISPLQDQLFNYQGGPGSNYGIGFTRIFRATDSQGAYTSTQPSGNPTTGVAYSSIGLTYQRLAEQNTVNPALPTVARIQDFRNQLTGNQVKSDYEAYNIARPFNGIGGLGVGNPGGLSISTDYKDSKPDGIDLLNQKNLFYYNASNLTPWDAGAETNGLNYTKDIIKFAFECMSNDSPKSAIALIFRAFFDGQISDSNTAQYNSFKYLGRGETFRTYQGFDRSIGFTFKVYPQSREELKPLYKKLNHLISQVYPDYSQTYNLMRGNVVKLTIGDYLYRVPGFIENVNVTIDNNETPWEIVLQKDEYPDVAQLPHLVSVNITFKPIMNFLPRRENIDNRNVPLITTTNFLRGASIEGKYGITQGLQEVPTVEGFGRGTGGLNPIVTQRRALVTNTINASINPNLQPSIGQPTGFLLGDQSPLNNL